MADQQHLKIVQDWPGRTLVDRDGTKIGKIDDIYFDNATDRPEWARVSTGLFGKRQTVVPIIHTTFAGDDIQVPFDKDTVKDAPNVEADDDLTKDEEITLARHYGLEYSEARSPSGLPSGPAGKGGKGKSSVNAMTRYEEELDVSKARRPSELVRLKKHVVTENKQVTVPVQREEVRVEREPITDANRDQAMSGPDITEGEHDVTLHEEEVVVQKRTVPKERVRLDKDVSTEERTVDEPVRKEQIDVERKPRR